MHLAVCCDPSGQAGLCSGTPQPCELGGQGAQIDNVLVDAVVGIFLHSKAQLGRLLLCTCVRVPQLQNTHPARRTQLLGYYKQRSEVENSLGHIFQPPI